MQVIETKGLSCPCAALLVAVIHHPGTNSARAVAESTGLVLLVFTILSSIQSQEGIGLPSGNQMKRPLLNVVAILGLTMAAGSTAFAGTIFYLNVDETPGSPPANTIKVDVELTSTGPDNTATVTFTNLDPSNDLYDFHNVFLNVNGASAIGTSTLNTCTAINTCGFITGTGAGNGSYYYVANQSGGFGAMTYNVDDTGTAATSVTVDLVATGGNSWTSSNNVLTPDASGYDASVELLTQSGFQAAGAISAVPEPSGSLLLGAGLLAMGLVRFFKRASSPR